MHPFHQLPRIPRGPTTGSLKHPTNSQPRTQHGRLPHYRRICLSSRMDKHAHGTLQTHPSLPCSAAPSTTLKRILIRSTASPPTRDPCTHPRNAPTTHEAPLLLLLTHGPKFLPSTTPLNSPLLLDSRSLPSLPTESTITDNPAEPPGPLASSPNGRPGASFAQTWYFMSKGD